MHTFVKFIVIIVIACVFTYYSTTIVIPIRDIIRKNVYLFLETFYRRRNKYLTISVRTITAIY